MAWEHRNGTGRYYTRSRREAGRVIREYIGAGQKGEYAAHGDEDELQHRVVLRALASVESRKIGALDELLGSLAANVQLLTTCTLLAAGFHQHSRGDWRRRRGAPPVGKT